MKTFSHCPKCHGPLLNDPPFTIGKGYWLKWCNKYTDHFVKIKTVPGDDDKISSLTIFLGPDKLFTWFPEAEICWSSKTWDLECCVMIPYFEPDFSDYRKLINKIKTYLLFS